MNIDEKDAIIDADKGADINVLEITGSGCDVHISMLVTDAGVPQDNKLETPFHTFRSRTQFSPNTTVTGTICGLDIDTVFTSHVREDYDIYKDL